MPVHDRPNRALTGAVWGWIERLSNRVNRAARKRAALRDIAFSTDCRSPQLGPMGLMQMLDAMPGWTFDPEHGAFTTRSAAASPTARAEVTQAELNELIEALRRVRPGPIWLNLVGLPWSQTDQVKPYVRLEQGGSLTSSDAPREPLAI